MLKIKKIYAVIPPFLLGLHLYPLVYRFRRNSKADSHLNTLLSLRHLQDLTNRKIDPPLEELEFEFFYSRIFLQKYHS